MAKKRKSLKDFKRERDTALAGFEVAMKKLDQLTRACESHDTTAIEQTAAAARGFLDESGYKTIT